MSATHTITTHSKQASEKGALDGWEFLCSCGDRQGTSLGRNEALRMADKHIEYWTNKAKKTRKATI